MGEVSALNYKALSLSGNAQLGSDTSASSKSDLTDGLSKSELEKIDKDKDGIITEEEFKKAYKGKDAQKYWDTYTSFYKASSKTAANGTTTLTQTLPDGTKVQSTFDKSGNVTGYKNVKNNKDKSVTTTIYDKDGNKTAVTTVLPDGSSTKYNCKSKGYTHTAADGTSVSTDSSGKVTSVKTGSGSLDASVAYKGNDVKSVKIGDKTYTNVTSKDGNFTVKDAKGNIVLTLTTKKNGEVSVAKYKNGKRTENLNLNSDKEPKSIFEYDKNGNATKRTYCNTGKYRTYERDSSGNIKTSTDYNKDGVKTSSQTYETTNGSKYFENNSDALWSTRTYYDKDGKVSKYETYSYKKNDDKTVTKTTSTYADKAKKNLKSTTTTELNSYANKLSSVKKDAATGETSKTEYNYRAYVFENNKDVNSKTAYVSKKHLESVVTTTGNQQVTKNYSKNGLVESTETKTIGETKNNTTPATDKNTKETEDKKDEDSTKESEKSDGTKTVTSTSRDPEDDYDETYDSNGNLLSGNYTIKALLKKLYPEMYTKSAIDIARRLAKKFNLSTTDKISYDWQNKICQIELPEIKDKGYGLYVAVGYTDTDINFRDTI